jgi:hypothetical protein
MQVLAGIEWRFGQRLSFFVEYKLSCAAISATLNRGGNLQTNLCAHQLLAGPALHLAPREEVTGIAVLRFPVRPLAMPPISVPLRRSISEMVGPWGGGAIQGWHSPRA